MNKPPVIEKLEDMEESMRLNRLGNASLLELLLEKGLINWEEFQDCLKEIEGESAETLEETGIKPPVILKIRNLERSLKMNSATLEAFTALLIKKGVISKEEYGENWIEAIKLATQAGDDREENEEPPLPPESSEMYEHELAYREEYKRRGIKIPSREQFEADVVADTESRRKNPHHYHFIHRAFRDACQDDQKQFFSSIYDKNKRWGLLKALWQDTCRECSETGKPDFRLANIRLEFGNILGYPAILAIMPPPRHTTEAYMAMAVMLVQADEIERGGQLPEFAETAFITIERSHYEVPVIGMWKGANHEFLAVTKNLTPEEIISDPSLFTTIARDMLYEHRDELAWRSLPANS